MRIASWNVNSVRLRRRSIGRFARQYAPDVLCLQETKVVDALFPRETFRRLGYAHQAIRGQKSYNGVAILSKLPLSDVSVSHWCRRDDCRHVFATLPGGVELHNIYVPAGGDVPDPEQNEKFAHKLQFFREITRWFRRQGRKKPRGRSVLVGDLNVAPLDNDVWSHKQLRRAVTHTPVEVEAMSRLASSRGWVDAVRHFVPEPEKLYSWWSYRAADWRRVDKGRRLDHIWVTPSLVARLRSASIVKKVRGWRLPSDHAPVIVDLDVNTFKMLNRSPE